MQNILMIVFSDIKNDPRVYRHICFLKDRYNITAIGYENPEIDGVSFIKVKIYTKNILNNVRRAILLKLGKFDECYWSSYDYSEVIDKLKKLADKCKNVFILDPVPNSEIIREINKYDLGFYILPSNNFNNLNALPNKIFEFIQARLGVVSAPSPEFENLVKKYSLGVITEDFTPESAAKAISSLTYDDVMNFKNNAHKYAYELSSEKNREKYLEIVKNLIG